MTDGRDAVIPDLTLADEGDHRGDFPPAQDFWHQNFFSLVGTADGHDLMLMTRADLLRATDPMGQWHRAGEFLEHETTLIVVPSSRRGNGMVDHDFVHHGHYWSDLLPSTELQIIEHDTAVEWKAERRTFHSAPPVWRLTGEHGGVDLDLTFTQQSPTNWFLGSFANAKESNIGGYDVYCRVEGTIGVAGKRFDLTNAFGVRQNLAVGQNTRIIENLPPPDRMYWGYLVNDDICLDYLFYPKPGLVIGFVRAFGEDVRFAPLGGVGTIEHEVLDHWIDPRSGQALASRWRLRMQSERGALDLEIAAHGRSYMYWTMRDGLRMEIWHVATVTGTYRNADGRTLELKDQLMCVNPSYTIARARETITAVDD